MSRAAGCLQEENKKDKQSVAKLELSGGHWSQVWPVTLIR